MHPRRIELTLVAGLILVCALGLGAYALGASARNAFARMQRQHEIRTRTAAAAAALAENDAGQRAMIITGDESNVVPQEQTGADLQRILNDLRTLAPDSGVPSLERLPALEARVRGRLAAGQEILDAYRQGGIEAARKLLHSDRTRQAMDELQRRLNQIDDETRDAMERSALATRTHIENARRLAAAAALLAALVILSACRIGSPKAAPAKSDRPSRVPAQQPRSRAPTPRAPQSRSAQTRPPTPGAEPSRPTRAIPS